MTTSRDFFKLAEKLAESVANGEAPRHVRIGIDKDATYIWEISIHDAAENLVPDLLFSSVTAIPWPETTSWVDFEPWSYKKEALRIPATEGVTALASAWAAACASADPLARVSKERQGEMRERGAWV